MDVAGKAVLAPQLLGDEHHLFHRVVGGPDDAGGQEKSFDIIALIKFGRQRHDLVDREPRAADVRGASIDAVGAVVQTVVGEQDFE